MVSVVDKDMERCGSHFVADARVLAPKSPPAAVMRNLGEYPGLDSGFTACVLFPGTPSRPSGAAWSNVCMLRGKSVARCDPAMESNGGPPRLGLWRINAGRLPDLGVGVSSGVVVGWQSRAAEALALCC